MLRVLYVNDEKRMNSYNRDKYDLTEVGSVENAKQEMIRAETLHEKYDFVDIPVMGLDELAEFLDWMEPRKENCGIAFHGGNTFKAIQNFNMVKKLGFHLWD